MNDRERFLATMAYGPRDRAPICDFGFWNETPGAWHAQGLDSQLIGEELTVALGMDLYEPRHGFHVSLYPGFEVQVLEDRGATRVVRQWDGVTALEAVGVETIPQYLSHLLVDRQSWEEHYRWRLDPATAGRLGDDIHHKVEEALSPGYPHLRAVTIGSLYGWIRDWMGLEGVSYIVYDDPALFEEMVETLVNLAVGMLDRIVGAGYPVDAVAMWEDMCYGAGPLLSPDVFRRVLVPGYRRIRDAIDRHGIPVVWLDSDGKIDSLIPLWLDAGIDCLFPIEVGSWKADVVAYRKEYGRNLRMMGGFDKHILRGGPEAIDREVRRLNHVVEEGGYVPFCDHRVPPDVPLDSYLWYIGRIRSEWGHGVNLKPIVASLAGRVPEFLP